MRQRALRNFLIGLFVAAGFALGITIVRIPARRSKTNISWRQVTACDGRKTVVAEGYPESQPLPPAKARQVASLLTDLMRYCNEEVRATITTDQQIFLSVNGSAFVQYVPGGPLPLLPVQGKLPSQRDEQIWKAELARVVDQGNKLFHNSKLGTNGISCDMCHPNASNTHAETYPKFQTQLKKVALLRDMINWCIENPLEGTKLAEDDPQLKALEAYILSQRNGVALEAGKH